MWRSQTCPRVKRYWSVQVDQGNPICFTFLNRTKIWRFIKILKIYRDLKNSYSDMAVWTSGFFEGSKNNPKIEARIILRNGELWHKYWYVIELIHKYLLKIDEKRYRTMIATSRLNIRRATLEKKRLYCRAILILELQTLEMIAKIALWSLKVSLNCAVHQFHYTSYHFNLRKSWDIEDNFI